MRVDGRRVMSDSIASSSVYFVAELTLSQKHDDVTSQMSHTRIPSARTIPMRASRLNRESSEVQDCVTL